MTMETLPQHTPATNPHLSLYPIARVASALALVALLIGGSLMAATTPLQLAAPADDPWRPVREQPAIFALAAVALALISTFDLFTIPALHQRLHRDHPTLIVVATITAALGDVLGVIGRLLQLAEVPAAMAANAHPALIAVVENTFNTAGFALVSVSFTCFGFAMLTGFRRWLGIVGVIAGVATALGQLPGWDAVFAIANLAFVAWYIGLIVGLRPASTR